MSLPELTPWWFIWFAVRGEIVGGVIMKTDEIGYFPDKEALEFAGMKDPETAVTGCMLDTAELRTVGSGKRVLNKASVRELGKKIRMEMRP